jgi:hypothetical protein
MTRYLKGWLARCLAPEEREAVLGDLAESGESGGRALLGLLGLILRRQVIGLMTWRRVSALSLAVPLGWYLGRAIIGTPSLFSLDFWIILNYKDLDPVVLAENHMSLHHSILAVVRGTLLLAGGSWVSGYVLAWLSRRAFLVTVLFAAIVAFYPLRLIVHWTDFGLLFKLVVLAMLPAIAGMVLGGRKSAA